jgi:hypothetical protein
MKQNIRRRVSRREDSNVSYDSSVMRDLSPSILIVACIVSLCVCVRARACVNICIHILIVRGNINKLVIILRYGPIADDDPRNGFQSLSRLA